MDKPRIPSGLIGAAFSAAATGLVISCGNANEPIFDDSWRWSATPLRNATPKRKKVNPKATKRKASKLARKRSRRHA